MDKLFAVIRREYLERVRSKWFVIATIFGPVLFGLLMFLPALLASRSKGDDSVAKIIIVDATGTNLGDRIAGRLSGGISGGSGLTQVRVVNPDSIAPAESLATADVMAEKVKGYLVVDSSTVAGQRARYSGSNTTALIDMNLIERGVQREVMSLRLERSGIDPDVGRQIATMNVNVSTERLTSKGRGGSGQINFVFGLAVAMLLYMTIFIYGLNVLRGVMEEKQTRVAEVVISSVPAGKLLAGKVIGVGGVGFTQLVLWLGMSYVLFQIRAPVLARFGITETGFNLPQISFVTAIMLLAFFVMGFMFYAGLFAAVGATVNSEQEAQQAQMPVVLLLVGSIIFVQNVLLSPDGTLSRTMSILPFSAPIIMPLRMTVAPVPPLEIALALLSVTIGAFASVWVASRIYRVGLLMYGKRPGIREIARWIGQK